MTQSDDTSSSSLDFSKLITMYNKMQKQLVQQISDLTKSASNISPGDFLLLQFMMAKVAQVGESLSNLISQVNSIISNAIRNQKTQ